MSLSTRFEGFEDPSDRADDDADGTASCNIFRISSEDNGNRVLEPLNKAARNQIARRDPTVALAAIAHARARLANQEGFLKKEDWVVSWEAAFISHHLQFTVKCTQGEFRHLASVTNRAIKDPAQYARDLMALANAFLAKPPESHQPHFPFTRLSTGSTKLPNLDAGKATIIRTIEHAQWITSRHKSLENMDIPSAEATAKLVNADRICPGLLAHITSAEYETLDTMTSKKSPKPLRKANRRMNNKGNELQGLVEPSRTITKYPQRRPSLAQELDKELKDLRQVSVNAQERTPSAEAVVDETVVSNESSGDQASESQPVQPKKSNRKYIKNKNKKKTKLSQSAPLNQTMHGQTANPQQSVNENETLAQPAPPKCLQSEQWENVAIPASIAATVEHKSPQQDPFIQKSDAENHILAQPATENLPSQVLATKNRPASTNISEKALPQHHVGLQEVALPLGPLNGQADAPDVQKGESESEQSLIAFPDLEEGPDPEYSAEDQLYMRYDPSQEDPQNRPEPLSLNGPPHNDSPEDSGYPSPISDCIQGLGSGTQGLQWAYKTRKEVDGLLEGAGVWLWKKPTTYYQRSPLDGLTKSNFQGLRKAPVTISHYSTGTGHPRLEYDRYNVQIVPHAIPWQDIRSDICHPDFLVPCKLMEYQACEAAGYRVWRHDRDLLSCRKTGCGVQISDYNHSTIICSGCGPKTVVRYCSFQHQVEDTGEHWQECGHPDLVMRSVIDHTTEPAYFANFCRVIHSKYGIRSAALHRQRLFASLTYGLYTLFNPFTQHPTTLLWPRQDPICIEMNERIERLLNVGLLACDQKIVLSYLYRLLRESLYRNGEWTYSTQYALSTQFTSEFGRILVHSQNITNGAPCECEWYGSFFSPLVHSTNCPPRPDGRWPRYGVKDIVENLEEKYWILRAWRQQHPTLRDWRSRATESVYKTERQRREAMRRGVDGQQEICRLGPGWSGWGGKEDSMCA